MGSRLHNSTCTHNVAKHRYIIMYITQQRKNPKPYTILWQTDEDRFESVKKEREDGTEGQVVLYRRCVM